MQVFIGAAWPYASGPRHLGHVAGVYLPADVLARYHRLAGDDVLFVSGSDQHGTPVTLAAERAGLPPQRFADEQHEAIAESFVRLGISFDRYTKTGTTLHAETTQSVFRALHDRGFLNEGWSRSAWCPKHEHSLPDRYVEGICPRCGAGDARGDQCDACGSTLDPEELLQPRCSRCGTSATFRDLRQVFLRLDALAGAVRELVEFRGRDWPTFVTRETLGWLDTGLRPRAITRDIDHGVAVPLPGWEDRRLYVWFDAVIGYLTASIEWARDTGEPDAWRHWWLNADALHRYVIGKDNVWFHSLWWPAILAGSGTGLHLPDRLDASHHLTVSATKFSASQGRGDLLDAALERVGTDPLRHALCALRPESGDTDLAWPQVEDLTRTGLLGAIANPCYRVASLLWQRFGGAIDAADRDLSGRRARDQSEAALRKIGAHINAGQLRAALQEVHELGRTINRRLAEEEPWRADDARARETLGTLVPLVDAIGIAASPFVPTTAGRIRALLGRSPAERWALDQAPPRSTSRPDPPLQL